MNWIKIIRFIELSLLWVFFGVIFSSIMVLGLWVLDAIAVPRWLYWTVALLPWIALVLKYIRRYIKRRAKRNKENQVPVGSS